MTRWRAGWSPCGQSVVCPTLITLIIIITSRSSSIIVLGIVLTPWAPIHIFVLTTMTTHRRSLVTVPVKPRVTPTHPVVPARQCSALSRWEWPCRQYWTLCIPTVEGPCPWHGKTRGLPEPRAAKFYNINVSTNVARRSKASVYIFSLIARNANHILIVLDYHL